MTWGEALRLTRVLLTDSTSHVGASVAGLAHPVAPQAAIFADLYDLVHQIVSKSKAKPYPRSWMPSRQARRAKPDQKFTQEQIIGFLRDAGHDLPMPKGAT